MFIHLFIPGAPVYLPPTTEPRQVTQISTAQPPPVHTTDTFLGAALMSGVFVHHPRGIPHR